MTINVICMGMRIFKGDLTMIANAKFDGFLTVGYFSTGF